MVLSSCGGGGGDIHVLDVLVNDKDPDRENLSITEASPINSLIPIENEHTISYTLKNDLAALTLSTTPSAMAI
ncbi:hypothetical protein MNKW57_20560 [Biformimicrobium ophioploci]|uniref:Uncharacterized protein n=1 Tax=Biformimicrobium ophioploci TaxID=3036711 RepID=A0ABQ6M066_9GAMM|nr:hypothetical protein MNKW57_20560 [Microbulbifer sp. NKW57]